MYNFNSSKNNKYNGDELSDFNFFDFRLDSLDITADTEIFGLDLSIYTILARYLSYKSSILKTIQERLNYIYIFERLALEDRFLEISNLINSDIIENCRNQKIKSIEKAYKYLVKVYCLSLNQI